MAVLLFLAVATSLPHLLFQDVVNVDAVRYIHAAQAIYAGHWEDAAQHSAMPFVPALIACAYWIFGDWVLAGQMISMLAMSLLLIPFYCLSRDIFEADQAFLSCLFFSVLPLFREISASILRDPLYLLSVMSFLLFFFRALRSSSIKDVSGAGLSAFFSALSRIEGFFLLAFFAIWTLGRGVRSSDSRVKGFARIAVLSILLGFVSLLAISEFSDFEHINRIDEALAPLRSPVEFYDSLKIHDVHARLRALQYECSTDGHGGYVIRAAANHVLELSLVAVLQELAECVFLPTFLLSLIGILARFSSHPNRSEKILLLWFAFFLSIPYIFIIRHDFISRRYVMAAGMILCFWAGPGLCWLRDKAQVRFPCIRRYSFVFLILFLALFCSKNFSHGSGSEENIAQAGRWLRENAVGMSAVTNDFRILFYRGDRFCADSSENVSRKDDWQSLFERAKNLHADFAVWRGSIPEGMEPLIVFPGKRPVSVYRLSQ